MWEKISDLWCRKMHKQSMWPIHGRYVCSECLREHTIEWSEANKQAIERTPAQVPPAEPPGRFATM
jgi:hypothetical protein